MHKCEPQERNPCAPKYEERTLQETLRHERCARREAWDLAKHVYKLNTRDKATFHSPYRSIGNAGTLRGERIRGRFRSVDAHAEQEADKDIGEVPSTPQR